METTLNWNEFESLANRFKVLSEPARLQILAAICNQEQSVQAICDRTGLHQGNVSKHLRLLKDAGVVACRREGAWRYYRVIDQDLLALCTRAKTPPQIASAKTDTAKTDAAKTDATPIPSNSSNIPQVPLPFADKEHLYD